MINQQEYQQNRGIRDYDLVSLIEFESEKIGNQAAQDAKFLMCSEWVMGFLVM